MVEENHYELLRDAIFDNDISRVKELLAIDGVDVDQFDAGGQTLLHLASFWGRMELVKVFLNAGASLKTKNAAGCTALDLAMHWGHSAVAEVLRLRGGSSVWEDKLGSLQAQLEDANLRVTHIQGLYNDKSTQCEALLSDVHALQTRIEEVNGAHLLTMHHLDEARHELDVRALQLEERSQIIRRLTDDLHTALVARADAEHLRDTANQEARDMLTHRNEILAEMQGSVAKQEQATHNWQRAEVAAAIAESQRNFALGERDQYQKRHAAALGELVVATSRLAAAQNELTELKTELAEYIYEYTRMKRSQKRAAKALEALEPRNTTPPATQKTGSPDKAARPSIPETKLIPEASSDGSSTIKTVTVRGVVLPKQPKKQFSLAAREFGNKMRVEEKNKKEQREKQLQRVENQFLADGLHVRVADSDRFQEEFVSTVRAFTAARSDRWRELKRERDHQTQFAKNTLARSISTAPAVGPASMPTNADVSNGMDVMPDKPRLTRVVDYQVYGKCAAVTTGSDGRFGVGTSPVEMKMRAAFFATPKAVDDSKVVKTSSQLEQSERAKPQLDVPLGVSLPLV